MRNSFKSLLCTAFFLVLMFSLSSCVVADKTINEITIDQSMFENTFEILEFNIEDYFLTIIYSDGSTEQIAITEAMISSSDLAKLNNQGSHTIEVVYQGFTISITINLKASENVIEFLLHSLYNRGIDEHIITNLTYEEWIATIRGERGLPGEDNQEGREILLKGEDDFIWWQYQGDIEWTKLFSILLVLEYSSYELYIINYPDYQKSEIEWLEDYINNRLLDIQQWTIVYDYNDGISESIIDVVSNLEKLISPIEPIREGYTFLGWYVVDEKWNFDRDFVTENITLTAKWSAYTDYFTFEDAGVTLSWYDPLLTNYYINNVHEFNGIGYLVQQGVDFKDKSIYLESDLDFDNENIVSIGAPLYDFLGTFDGQNYSIINYVYTNENLVLKEVTRWGSTSTYYNSSIFYSNGGIVKNLRVDDYILDLEINETPNILYRFSILVFENFGLFDNCNIKGIFDIEIDSETSNNISFSPFVIANIGVIKNSGVHSITNIISNQTFYYGHFGLSNQGYLESNTSSGSLVYERTGVYGGNKIGGLFSLTSPVSYFGSGPNVVNCSSDVNITTSTYKADEIGGLFSRYSGEMDNLSYSGSISLSSSEIGIPLMGTIGGISAFPMSWDNYESSYSISNSEFSGEISLAFTSGNYFHYDLWSTPEIVIGGIVGAMFNSKTTNIENNIFSGKISIVESYATENNNVQHYIGGIVGQINITIGEDHIRHISIQNCENTGEIYADTLSEGSFWTHIGGIVGTAVIAFDDPSRSPDNVSINMIECLFKGQIQIGNTHNKYITMGGISGSIYSTLIENSSAYGTFIVPSDEVLFGSIVGYASYSMSLDMGKTMGRIINTEGEISVVLENHEYVLAALFGAHDFAYLHRDAIKIFFENNYYYSLLDMNEQLFYEDLYNLAYELAIFDTTKRNINYFGPLDYVRYNLTYQEAMNIIIMFQLDNPNLHFIDISEGVYTFNSLDHFIGIPISDRYSDIKISDDDDRIDLIINTIKLATSDMSQYDKLQYIYNFLQSNVEYTTYTPSRSTIVGSLLEGEANCQGYAFTFKMLCDELGLECIVVASDVMDHAWNLVHIDDHWYIVDVTWADTSDAEYFLIGNNESLYHDINPYLDVPFISEEDYHIPTE